METTKKITAAVMMAVWAAATLFALCFEETPGSEMSLTAFVAVKGIALTSLYLLVRAATRKSPRP